MSSEPIVLFDLPSKAPCKCWSLNPWKSKSAWITRQNGLNIRTSKPSFKASKHIIRSSINTSLAKSVSVSLPESSANYTIPTVRLPDGTYIMDSMEIANYIEEKNPSPSVHLDSPYVDKVVQLLKAAMEMGTGVRGVFFPLVPERLLNPPSVDYWMETRPKAIGKPLSELTDDERGGKAWENVAKPIGELTRLLKENPEGPFFEGKTVTYADFCWVGFLLFWQRIGDDVFQKIISASGDAYDNDNVHLKLLEAVKPWAERNDH
ncbi:putative Glutathione S-transferase [Seiridium cardinale]|uniref:Glutathione S-transferase n=1 Tax=Seiridium cardinale TaxID=138064 RepID=A0ABR2Y144_9PEZI